MKNWISQPVQEGTTATWRTYKTSKGKKELSLGHITSEMNKTAKSDFIKKTEELGGFKAQPAMMDACLADTMFFLWTLSILSTSWGYCKDSRRLATAVKLFMLFVMHIQKGRQLIIWGKTCGLIKCLHTRQLVHCKSAHQISIKLCTHQDLKGHYCHFWMVNGRLKSTAWSWKAISCILQWKMGASSILYMMVKLKEAIFHHFLAARRKLIFWLSSMKILR